MPVRLAGGTCWSIMDKDVYEYMLDGDEECAQLWEEMIAKADDAYKADTLEELAEKLNMPADAL